MNNKEIILRSFCYGLLILVGAFILFIPTISIDYKFKLTAFLIDKPAYIYYPISYVVDIFLTFFLPLLIASLIFVRLGKQNERVVKTTLIIVSLILGAVLLPGVFDDIANGGGYSLLRETLAIFVALLAIATAYKLRKLP